VYARGAAALKATSCASASTDSRAIPLQSGFDRNQIAHFGDEYHISPERSASNVVVNVGCVLARSYRR
jgi:hypothetical protein